MKLSAGTRLGAYEILAPIGKGGMGEVYKAKDTRLDRTVAIKVLPSHLADNARLRERFEREARAVSALNHPHICILYDVGIEDGTDFLVMEFIEGQTLADRLKKGALPFEEALRYGAQMADALDKAHREGVVHRDVKPGNVMLTESGIKLLDFGLATRLRQGSGGAGTDEDSEVATEQRPLTEEGAVLGTFQYMAPEQLEGKDADPRSDIFALGAVLYEMVSGRKAFEGKSQASLITAIMSREPRPLAELQPMSPPLLDHLVSRCLAKEAARRWQNAGDLKLELSWLLDSKATAADAAPTTSAGGKTPWLLPALMGLIGALVAGSAVWLTLTSGARPSPPRKQFSINLPSTDEFPLYRGRLALSPDGTRLVYAGRRNGVDQLFLRSFEGGEVEPLPGTEGGAAPFFSPDGEWVGFFANDALKKVAVAGGAPVTLDDDVPSWGGGSWGPDGTIVYAQPEAGLYRVPASGGVPEPMTDPSSSERYFEPEFLPDGESLLFVHDDRIAVLSLETGESRDLLDGRSPRFSRTGHIVFLRNEAVWAVPFDPQRLELTGDSALAVEGVYQTYLGATYDIADDDTLVYEPASGDRELVWVDRQGRTTPLSAEPDTYFSPRLSPDGNRLVVHIFATTEGDIWLLDVERGSRTRWTCEGAGIPVWTPDGTEVTIVSFVGGLLSVPADGSAEPRPILTMGGVPGSWSPDGKTLAFHNAPAGNRDIYVFTPSRDDAPKPFLVTPFQERNPAFSPDGRWLAYVSDESGRDEVYVRPYPGPGGKFSISIEGGIQPVWSPAGGELFYREGDKMMVVAVEKGATFRSSKPKVLFEGSFATGFLHNPNYTVSPDGQRFVMIQEVQLPHFEIVLNWANGLER